MPAKIIKEAHDTNFVRPCVREPRDVTIKPPEDISLPVDEDYVIDSLEIDDEPPPGGIRIISYRQMEQSDIMAWLGSIEGYATGLLKMDNKRISLQQYQKDWMADRSNHKWTGKSRRVGISLAMAMSSMVEAQLTDLNKEWTFISYTMEEATNKIEYARMLYDSIPEQFKRKKMRDRRQSLEFHDPIKNTKTVLKSHAQRAPRGGGGVIILDEFAFFQWAKKILEAAQACILTNDGSLVLASTPFGEGDPFHEIGYNPEKYPKFSRQHIYWWECDWLCHDLEAAKIYAEHMTTEERVERFGTEKLKDVFLNYIDIDSFRQEMEIKFLSDNFRFYPAELIRQCVYPWDSQIAMTAGSSEPIKFRPDAYDTEEAAGSNMAEEGWLDHEGKPNPSAYRILEIYKGEKIEFMRAHSLDHLARLVQTGRVSENLYAGYDVARSGVHSCELYIVEEKMVDSGILRIERYAETVEMDLPAQSNRLMNMMRLFPNMRLGIDANGIGDHMHQELNFVFPNRVVGYRFENEWKKNVCIMVKRLLQGYGLAIAENRTTISHMHSIRKSVTQFMNEVFQADNNEKHHGDRFWALAMACAVGTPQEYSSIRLDRGLIGSPKTGFGRDFAEASAPGRGRIIRPNGWGAFNISDSMQRTLNTCGLGRLPDPFSLSGLKNPRDL